LVEDGVDDILEILVDGSLKVIDFDLELGDISIYLRAVAIKWPTTTSRWENTSISIVEAVTDTTAEIALVRPKTTTEVKSRPNSTEITSIAVAVAKAIVSTTDTDG
jgi:hypothetical protein